MNYTDKVYHWDYLRYTTGVTFISTVCGYRLGYLYSTVDGTGVLHISTVFTQDLTCEECIEIHGLWLLSKTEL